MSRVVWRFRLGAVCLLLMTFAILQSPGQTAADTKLDLTVDPAGFLGRALHLWDPQGFFGQLQNQAYGYLFPMGPFFAVGDAIGLPGWFVQRLWWGLLLCVAFLGVVALMTALGRGTSASSPPPWPLSPLAAVVGGLAYALAPRMVSTLGPISAESLPMALAPWLLVPLVLADQGRSPRRMAALSGLALVCAGAVNAVATLAVLPLGVWWLITRPKGRRAVAGWWVLAVALASVWWLVPLVVLGRYSPPFLDWIESAAITTRPNELGAVLRGTSHWVPYVVEPGGPAWPAGFTLVSDRWVILAGSVVLLLGLIGLTRRTLVERTFLVGALAIGVVMVSFGHTGSLPGLGAATVQDLLDGVLAPLRNVHKGDLVLRLPLAVAAGFLVSEVWQRRASWRGSAVRGLVAGGALAAVVVASLPFWTGDLTTGRTHEGLPGYWADAADWLADRDDGRALVVPGSAFGTYIWGRSQDEPLQALARTPWGVRDVVPLSSAGNIRLLDAVDEVLTTGRGSPALAQVLARSGVRWLVVRNDLDGAASPPRSVLVHQALDRSPGLARRTGFGPLLEPYRLAELVADDGLQQAYQPVEIWEVTAQPAPVAAVRDLAAAIRLTGGPEALLPVAEAGLLGDRAAVLDGDDVGATAGLDFQRLLTDTFRDTEVNFGAVRDNRSETRLEGQPYVLDRAVRDYYPVDAEGRQPTASVEGGTVTASSSGSSVDALRGRAPSAQPWAAVDGDPATAWISGDLTPGVGQWWQASWEEPRDLERLRVAFVVGGEAGVPPTRVRVTTDQGSAVSTVRPTDRLQMLEVPTGPTRSLRLTLAEVQDGSDGDAFGIAEVDLAGAPLARPLKVTVAAGAGPIVLTARGGERAGCVHLPQAVQCSRALPVPGEDRPGIDRQVALAEAGEYQVVVTVRPRPGEALDRLLAPAPGSARVTASSQLVSDPDAGPSAAVDRDPRTAWYADPLDSSPELRVQLPEPQQIDGLWVANPDNLAASQPLAVAVRAGGEERRGFVDQTGRLRFSPLVAKDLTVEFGLVAPVRSLDGLTGTTAQLPLAVAELRLLGAEDLLATARPFPTVTVPCGFGPRVELDGTSEVNTSVVASSTAVREGRLVTAQPCEPTVVRLSKGANRITVPSTAEFIVERVDLAPVGATASAEPPGAADVTSWGATTRAVSVPQGGSARLLETTENYNAGWTALLDGRTLDPVRVDGWRQAWLLPAGAGGDVAMTFTPQRWYAGGLAGGLLAVLALLALALTPGRSRSEPLRLAVDESPPAGLVVAGVAVASTLVAGLAGLLVACVVLLTVRRSHVVVVPAVVLGWAATTLVAVGWPWPASQSAPDAALVVASVGAVVALAAVAGSLLLTRWDQRWSGRSRSTHDSHATTTLAAAVSGHSRKNPPSNGSM